MTPTTTSLLRVFVLAVAVAATGCSSREPASDPPGRPATLPSESASVYTCPMHPDVRQAGPGRCPRCGMDLVAATQGAGPGHGHAEAPTGPGAHEDHAARHGGVLGMQGDVHIELVVQPDGMHRVFLSDAVRVPMAPERATAASLRFTPSAGGAPTEAALRADAATGALVAASALPATNGDITVRVTVGGEQVAMDFTAPSSGAATPPSTSAPAHPTEEHSHGGH